MPRPLPSQPLFHPIKIVHSRRTRPRWPYLAYIAIAMTSLSQKQPLQRTRIVSLMHVSRAGGGRLSVAENVRFASIAKTSSSHVCTQMANEIEPKGECSLKALSFLTDIRDHRQLGNLAGRLEEYEQLLEELSLRAGFQDQALIRRTLDRVICSDCMKNPPLTPPGAISRGR